MEADEQMKKNANRLLQQFRAQIGSGPPSEEALQMYSLTMDQYRRGLRLSK